jgi:hypothetical protein
MLETYDSIIDLGEAMEGGEAAVAAAAKRLSGATQLMLQLIKWRFGMTDAEAAVMRSCLSPQVGRPAGGQRLGPGLGLDLLGGRGAAPAGLGWAGRCCCCCCCCRRRRRRRRRRCCCCCCCCCCCWVRPGRSGRWPVVSGAPHLPLLDRAPYTHGCAVPALHGIGTSAHMHPLPAPAPAPASTVCYCWAHLACMAGNLAPARARLSHPSPRLPARLPLLLRGAGH